MNKNMLFETLKELIDNQRKRESKQDNQTKRKEASYIYLDEKDNQIKEIPLSKLGSDSSASAYINFNYRDYNYKNPVKLIHDFIFNKQLSDETC